MTIRLLSTLSALTLGLFACGSGTSGTTPDSKPSSDASSDSPSQVLLPSWMLEDVQPASPRVGQTYGLQTFADKIVVVTLLEGF
jgi:hypothetical protein